MPVFDLYSKRKKKAEKAGQPDVYQYDTLPRTLRVQITMILNDAIGPYYESDPLGFASVPYNANDTWDALEAIFTREKGVQSLGGASNAQQRCNDFILGADQIDDCLNIIDLTFNYIHRVVRGKGEHELTGDGIVQSPDDAINELNIRFREAGVGYQFEDGKILQVDSQFIHAEVVKPALQLLSDPRFKGPHEEFLDAHAHYRAGEYKDCTVDALNAFESTMKAICDAKGWAYAKGASAAILINTIKDEGLLPDYLDSSFIQLQAVLKSGLPKVRSETGGHGQGGQPKKTPGYVAAYALHLLAANIVFLVEAFKDGE